MRSLTMLGGQTNLSGRGVPMSQASRKQLVESNSSDPPISKDSSTIDLNSHPLDLEKATKPVPNGDMGQLSR